MQIEIIGKKALLGVEKVMYFQEKKILLVSDIHLGKVTHFRKAGIGIPRAALKQDFRELNDIIEKYKPEKLVLMGDLFHSSYNVEWEYFIEFMEVFYDVDFILVKGNHDILSSNLYEKSLLKTVDQFRIEKLIITHEPLEVIDPDHYNIHGHIHPGHLLRLGAKQSLRLPCFHFSNQRGVLPAFGRFTGLAMINPKPYDDVYVVTKEEVIKI
jgi:DNA ligase-associated metallophosphoesterase